MWWEGVRDDYCGVHSQHTSYEDAGESDQEAVIPDKEEVEENEDEEHADGNQGQGN